MGHGDSGKGRERKGQTFLGENNFHIAVLSGFEDKEKDPRGRGKGMTELDCDLDGTKEGAGRSFLHASVISWSASPLLRGGMGCPLAMGCAICS